MRAYQLASIINRRLLPRTVGIAIAAALAMSGCMAPKIYNEADKFALNNSSFDKAHPEYSFLNFALTERSLRLKPDLIIITLSGGGIRAAALAAATMDELHKFTIHGAPLTDNVVLVSSTSGGSIAAGYVAVHGFAHYSDFRKTFLERQNTWDLISRGFGPRLFYDRSAVFQEFLEERLNLGSMTFGDLITRNDRPYFVMNATDLSGGHSFTFTQTDFSKICTNLNPMPISVGVTASSAIPFLLTDVELKNRHDACLGASKEALPAFYFSARDAAVKRYDYNFRHAYDNSAGEPDRPRPKILHLADGGLADNLGAGGADFADIDAASSLADQIEPWIGSNKLIRQILVIEVNARSDKGQDDLDANSGSPGLLKMLGRSIDIPIDRATSLSDQTLQVGFQAIESMQSYVKDGTYLTQIDFDLIDNEIPGLRKRVKSIGTSLSLTSSELSDLELVARSLLRKSGCFARYLSASGAIGPGYVNPGPSTITGVPYDCPSLTDVSR